jgi:pyruvate/2-oxoglutarate dehydrogenase complex dihydrolipoamide dehydrogenase (E3) component
VEVNGETHTAETVIINAGGRPIVPPIDGLEAVGFLDNESAMELRELPSHLIVLGGGYIGCEFAQMYRRFGAGVTIVQRAPHLLPREDEEVSEALEEVFEAEGIGLRLGAEARSVRREGAELVVRLENGEALRGSHLLVAVGRRPNTAALDCEAAGVRLDDGGYVMADDRYRTTAEGVYAVGDVLGPFPQFTHSSWDDHRLLFDLLLGRGDRGRSDRVIPYCVFTDPQVARVGLSERDARERAVEYEVAQMPFGRVARAIETDEKAGVMKVLLDPRSERILGAALVGAEAGELIHIFVAVMSAGASARAIVDAEAVHPTFAEGVQTLVMRLNRYALS